MTRNTFPAAARRTLVSTLTAAVFALALPGAGLAATSSDDGIWKVNPAKSSFRYGSATLTIERAKAANPTAGSFIVISNGSVYRVTGATASDGKGVQQVDYARMATEGKAVLSRTFTEGSARLEELLTALQALREKEEYRRPAGPQRLASLLSPLRWLLHRSPLPDHRA